MREPQAAPATAVIGPAHAGKSTLIGTFLWREDPDGSEREIERARQSLASTYVDAQAFSYLVDLSADERERSPGRPGTTSKRMHIARVHLGDDGSRFAVDVVDTPGGRTFGRNDRLRGIFYADTLIFACEAIRTSNPDETGLIIDAVGSLLLACALKPDRLIIVAITKLDLVDDPAEGFAATKTLIGSLVPDSSLLRFVPVSVDVKGRQSRNVRNQDLRWDWFAGPSLEEQITDLAVAACAQRSTSVPGAPLVMLIEAQGKRAGLGPILLGKSLSGGIASGCLLDIVPARLDNGDYTVAPARVRSVERSAGRTVCSELTEGELGGFVPIFEGRSPAKIPRTALAIHRGTKVAVGHLVRVRTTLSTPVWLNPLHQAELLWLGRYHTVKVYDLRRVGDALEVSLVLRGRPPLAVPFASNDEDGLMFAQAQLSSDWSASAVLPVEIINVSRLCGLRLDGASLRTDFERLAKGVGTAVIDPFTFRADAARVDHLAMRIIGLASRNAPTVPFEWPLFHLVGECG